MKKLLFIFASLVAFSLLLNSCRSLNPSVMLRTGKDYQYTTFPDKQKDEYQLAPNDLLSFSIYSNDGFKMIDISSMGVAGATSSNLNNRMFLPFSVEFDGTVKFPLLGRVKLQGLSVREAENLLEQKYSVYYNKPYILLEVKNRRVIVFPGNGDGAARVITLQNGNTTLIEAIAGAGGISGRGKAHKVKLIRGDLKSPEVYLIDLSTIEGIKKAGMVLQANDIIYVEPQLRIGKDVIAEVLPYLSFVTTLIIFVEFISRNK
jgi:polysaccharide biosynthesis/export protein